MQTRKVPVANGKGWSKFVKREGEGRTPICCEFVEREIMKLQSLGDIDSEVARAQPTTTS